MNSWTFGLVIPIKVNYDNLTLYEASSLNLKIIWSKGVSFFVFLRSHKFIRRSHGSSLFVKVTSDAMYFYLLLLNWVDENWSLFLYTNMSSVIQNQLLQLILKSWHKPINKMDLQRDRNCSYWKEKTTSLITNSLQTTELKLMSC